MNGKIKERNRTHWNQHGFKGLLVCLILYLMVGPLFESMHHADKILSALLTLVLIAAVSALSDSRRLTLVANGVMLIAVGFLWMRATGIGSWQVNLESIAVALFLMILIYSFGRHLLYTTKVTGNTVCAALCLYLLIGVLWGCFFSILESVAPGSFSGVLIDKSDSVGNLVHNLQYFSFVTLSTLGYGDITPQTRAAGALCQSEAVIGQFLTMGLVARLVGIQVAQQLTKDSS